MYTKRQFLRRKILYIYVRLDKVVENLGAVISPPFFYDKKLTGIIQSASSPIWGDFFISRV